MPSTSSGPRFLGVDFHALWREVRKSWRGAHQWPVLAWLSPAVRVRLLQADEGESLWIGEVEQPKGTRLHQTRFCALELPEHIVLRGAGLRDVRAPSAATRIPGALKESYVIEFTLDPQFYGVVSVAEPQVGPKPLEAPAAKSEDVAAQASVSASSPAQAPIPVVPGGSALGGSAVYGENSARPATPKKTAELMSGAMPSASAPVVKTAP